MSENVSAVVEKNKKKDLVNARREEILAKVREFFHAGDKAWGHSKIFKEIFPNAPDSVETCEKWRDVGHALGVMLKAGEISSEKPEGKARQVFSAVRKEQTIVEEVKEVAENNDSQE